MSSSDLPQRLRAIDGGLKPAATTSPAPDVPRESPSRRDPRRRFPINVRETSLPSMSDTAWRALREANDPPQWFLQNGEPVRITGLDDENPHTEFITVDILSHMSARTAWWHKFTEKEGELEQFPLERVMKDMLADPAKPLPPLRRIVGAPVFGADGQLSTTPGYNPATGNYFVATGLSIPPVSLYPTDNDVARAVSLLVDELLVDFPFVGEAELAHAISLIINPFVRDMIPGPTPMYLIEAPQAGTGKGLLAAMALYPALGHSPVLMPPSANEEEMRKRLTSTLIGLPECILLDNVATGLDSPALAAVLTTTWWHDRMLGKSETMALRVRNTWVATGNNPSRSTEMSRRIIRIRLDSEQERPEERTGFHHPQLERWAASHRAELIHAALTIIQRWVAEGMPDGGAVLGSYDAWAQVHSGILECAGISGFLTNKRESEAIAMSDDNAWKAFVQSWWENWHEQIVNVSDIFPLAQAIPEFPLGRSSSDRGERIVFGRSMSQNRDRIFNGYRIEYVKSQHRLSQYRLRKSQEVPF